jgi:tetratricopeptide (TPR) repeat protein
MQNTSDTAIRQNLDLVYAHLNMGRIEDANLLCHSILRTHPNHPSALNILGIIAAHLDRPDVAIAMTKRASELEPDSIEFLENYAMLLTERQMGQQAIPLFRKILKSKPNSYAAHSNLMRARQNLRPADEQMPSILELLEYFKKVAQFGKIPIAPDHIFAARSMDISDFCAVNGYQVRHWPIPSDKRVPVPDWSVFPNEWRPHCPIFEERVARGMVVAKNADFWARRRGPLFDVFTDKAILIERSYQIPTVSEPSPENQEGLLLNLPGATQTIIGLRDDAPMVVVEEPAIFLNSADIYGHYLADILPKLAFCALDPELAKMPIYCAPIMDYQRELLVLLGLDHLNFHETDIPHAGTLHFKRGYLLGHVPYAFAFHWMNQRYKERCAPPKPPFRRLFLSRANMPVEKRRIANETEVRALLDKYDFEVILPEAMPVGEVLQKISEAAVIVTPIGSAVSNAIFAQPGTVFIEFMNNRIFEPEHHHWVTNYPMMAYLEVDYHGIMSEPMPGGTTVVDTALMIDLDVLTHTLKKCGIDPRGPL